MAVRTLNLAAAAALPSSPALRVPWSSLCRSQPPVIACCRSQWTRACSRLGSAVGASPSSNRARAQTQPLIDPLCLRFGTGSAPQVPLRRLLLPRRGQQPTLRRGGPLDVLGPHSCPRSFQVATWSANDYVAIPAATTSSGCWDQRHSGNGLEGWVRRSRSDTCPRCSFPRSLFPALSGHLGRISSPSARILPTQSVALGNCRGRRRGRGAVIKPVVDSSSRTHRAVGDRRRRRWESGCAIEATGTGRVGNYTSSRWFETRKQRQQELRRSPADCYRHVSTSPSTMASAKLERGEGDDGGKQGESDLRLSAAEGEKELSAKEQKKANRLVDEQSPYLLQHAYNPVDWYPWGEEAFAKARSENRPIFLSVGYSTCHWCHVMEVESFESEEVAKLMNDWFVNIKVDREERPDVDKVYMTYVQAMQGSGGWPMSVFLTPDLKPIVGGTYFPPNDMYGRLGFKTVLRRVKEAWEKSPDKLREGGDQAIQQLAEATSVWAEARDMANEDALEAIQLCVSQLASKYDGRLGGFGGAPKFPRPSEINILLRRHLRLAQRGDVKQSADRVLGMASFTLKCMSRGGMHDHIGGGFHRYSVDEYWHVPHFEKMLYDQGQLANAYLDAFLITSDTHFATMARDVLDYLRREMTYPGGGFFSAEDADSAEYEGGPKREGAFYAWTTDELEDILGSERFKVFASHYYVKEDGNCDLSKRSDPHDEFKGKNVLIERSSLAETAAKFGLPENKCAELLGQCRLELHLHRKKRPHPHLDDKIIVAWNGLAISAMARASRVLRSEPVEMKHHFPVEGCNPAEYLKAAENAASFLEEKLYDPSTKRLRRNYRNLPSEALGFIDDYAFLIGGLIDLYEAGGDIRWLTWALELQNTQDELFLDKEGGGYFSVPEGDSTILLRMKEDYDGAEPSGNSVAATNLLRLSAMLYGTRAENYRSTAEHVMAVFASRLKDIPMALPQLCCALDLHTSNIKRQIIVAGVKGRRDAELLTNCAHSTFEPDSVVLFVDDEDENVRAFWHEHNPNVLAMAKKLDGKAAAYICQNFVCKAPVTDPESMGKILREPPAPAFKLSTLDIQSAMDQATRPVS